MDRMQNHVMQDQRRQSRVSVQMECRFKSEDKEYGALMLDLSNGGTLISSTFLPDQRDVPDEEDKISITLNTGRLKAPLTLSGTIRRSSIGVSEYGKVAQFGVEFENTPMELLRLICALSSRQKAPDVSGQALCLYKSDGIEYKAVIIDLSQGGALLSSRYLPAHRSKIIISLQAENMEAPLMIEGMVSRRSMFGAEEDGKFGVEFENPPPELSQFINALEAERNKNRNTVPAYQ